MSALVHVVLLLSRVCTSILAYQCPNAKKLRRVAERAEKLAAMGVLPRREKLLQLRKTSESRVKEKPEHPKDPARSFYNLWSAGSESISVQKSFNKESHD